MSQGQSPRELIKRLEDEASNADTGQKILSDFTTDPEFWGYSKTWLFVMELPAIVLIFSAAVFLSGRLKLYAYIAGIVFALLGGLITIATPRNVDARSYFESIIRHFAHQQEMVFDPNPDESAIEQPKNESIPGRIARLPLVRDWLALLGLAPEYGPPQDVVPVEKPFRGEYAILRDDGALVAGIDVSPIPLRLDTDAAKKRADTAIADALEGTVKYDAEWVSPQRVADFTAQREHWEARTREFQSRADRLRSKDGWTKAAVRAQIRADIADERAANIDLREEVRRMRDFYMVVALKPSEVVIERSSEVGGVGSIPGFGKLVEMKRLNDAKGTDEHIAMMVSELRDRVDTLARQLNNVDGLTAVPQSSVEFSEVLADHYQGTNVYGYDDFTQCIRGSPSPEMVGTNIGDPEHEVVHQHLTNRRRDRDELSITKPTPTPEGVHAADGGEETSEAAAETGETDATSDQRSDTNE